MSAQTHFKNMCVRSINLNMEDICTGCLCSGRKLHSINDTGLNQLYAEILTEIPVQNMSQVCIQVCWECRYLLRKFHRFKEQVKRNYTELLWNIPTPSQPRLVAGKAFNISYPECPITDVDSVVKDVVSLVKDVDSFVKDEGIICDNIKTEAIDLENDEHREPVAFVKDYVANQKENKPTKKSKKKPKEKKPSKNKIKVKKKKKKDKAPQPEPEEANSDYEFVLEDDFQNEDDGAEDTEKEEGQLRKMHVEVEITKVESSSIEEDKSNELVPVLPVTKNVELLPEKPQCVECGKMFSSRKTYRYHLNVLHKGNNRYPCPRCGKIYQWKSNLGRHMRTHKAVDAGELYCSLCDKSFASVATYRQHLRISRRHVSENEFSFTCNECGKKFVNKTRLRDHIDWEHLKKIKFRCQLCNKPFKCHTSLYVHLQNVHRNKEKKDNLCHVCGKSYQNAAKLKYHIIALHTGETPYQCSQCAAAFGWYSSLYRHVREVHYKVKNQPKKSKKSKTINEPPGYMNYHQ